MKYKSFLKSKGGWIGAAIGIYVGYLFFRFQTTFDTVNAILWGLAGFITVDMAFNKKWTGGLIGGVSGLILSVSGLPVKWLGNSLFILISHGGGMSGYYIFALNVISTGILVGYGIERLWRKR